MRMTWITKSKLVLALSVIAGLLLIPGSSLAHHNHQAVTNYDVLYAVTGVVSQYEFINPHSLLHVVATNENGTREEWIGSGGGVAIMSRIGYKANMFQYGTEKVTMYGFPQRDGKKIMVFNKIVRSNGEELKASQVERNDLNSFMEVQHVKNFKDIPASVQRHIGGPPYVAKDDK